MLLWGCARNPEDQPFEHGAASEGGADVRNFLPRIIIISLPGHGHPRHVELRLHGLSVLFLNKDLIKHCWWRFKKRKKPLELDGLFALFYLFLNMDCPGTIAINTFVQPRFFNEASGDDDQCFGVAMDLGLIGRWRDANRLGSKDGWAWVLVKVVKFRWLDGGVLGCQMTLQNDWLKKMGCLEIPHFDRSSLYS